MKEFWDENCEKFSQKLWKPSNDLRKSKKEISHWDCDNKNISFTYFVPKKKVDVDIDFKPVPIPNNVTDKRKMFFGTFNTEIKRLETKIKKNNISQDDLKTYINKIKKIQSDATKITNSKKKHKEFIIKVGKELASFKKKSLKFNVRHNHYPIVTQHFTQVDKIYEKMRRLDDIIYCKKVKILPTTEQNDIIMSWVWNTIEIYNDLVEEFNHIHDKIRNKFQKTDGKIPYGKFLNNELKNNDKFPIGGKNLRDIKIHLLTEEYDVPFCIISDTIMEFASNLKGNLTKLQKYQIEDFTFNPRKFGRKNKTIPIQQHYTTTEGFYPSILGSIETDDESFDWKSICSDYKIVYNKYHHTFYLHIPSYRKVYEIDYERDPLAVMDPGMRAFQQLYGLDHIIAIGENMYWPIMEKLKKIESMDKQLKDDSKARKNKRVQNRQSKKISKTTRKNLRKAISRTHVKIKDMVSEMHNKLSIFLCKSYDRIMVTNFSSRKVNGKQKGLPKNHKKVLGKLSHYNFRQRLSQKCKEYRCQYLEVTEEYTSKTCCKCGKINNNLGKKKKFKCDSCDLSIDRDTNGAINIFIKNHIEVI